MQRDQWSCMYTAGLHSELAVSDSMSDKQEAEAFHRCARS